MLYSAKLNKEAPYRVLCSLDFGNRSIPCIIDTGCINTLVPLSFAKKYGKAYKNKAEIVVGGRKYEGALRSSILLGLNVLNHLDFNVSRNHGTFSFSVDVWELVKDKKFPFTMHFDSKELKPKYFSSLFIEDKKE
jgi:hypothetical protein